MDEDQSADRPGEGPGKTAEPRPGAAGGPSGERSRRGARIGILAGALTQVGSLVATIFLARLLTPADFGIIALSVSLLGLAQIFAISGIRAALVSRRSNLALASDTYFWLSLTMGLLVWAGVVLFAPWLTTLLDQPDAAPYLEVLTAAFVMDLIAIIPLAKLQREFRFSAFYAASLAGTFLYFIAQVALALAGLGAWSVIIGRLLDSGLALVTAAYLARWLPRLRFSRSILRDDARFTGGLTLNGAITYLQRNIDYWIVSAKLGGTALGIYYVAYVLPDLVRQRISAVSTPVLLPSYIQASQDEERLSRVWQRSWLVQMGLGLPALTGIACLAAPIVAVMFGPQWGAAALPMQVLTVVAIADIHMGTVSIMAVALRKVTWNSQVLAIRAVCTTVLAFSAAVIFGTLVSIAIGVALSAIFAMIFQEMTLSRNLHVEMKPIVRPLAAFATLAIIMSVVVTIFVVLTTAWPSLAQIVVGSAMGTATYFGVGVLVFPQQIRPLLRDLRLIGLGK